MATEQGDLDSPAVRGEVAETIVPGHRADAVRHASGHLYSTEDAVID